MCNKHHTQGTALCSPIDMFRAKKRGDIQTAQDMMPKAFGLNGPMYQDTPGQHIDFASWLPFASKKYDISPEPADYIIVPVISMPSELPNRNGVGFPLKDLVEFNPDYGRQAYKTIKGKGTYYEHANQEPLGAKGVNVDSFLRKFDTYGGGQVWKLIFLSAFCRQKDPELCRQITSGDLNSYSMGAFVSRYTCSICHRELGLCSHLNPNKKVDFNLTSQGLAYRQARGINFFENSAVLDPAFVSAASDKVMPMSDKVYYG